MKISLLWESNSIVPIALITGVTGQDGAYLSHFLLGKGYRVIGMLRRSASSDVIGERLRWPGISDRIELVDGNLTDLSSLIRLVAEYKPDEVYNLAAQSFVATSWQQSLVTGQVTGIGAVNMLEGLRIAHPTARFYQASSSKMFGKTQEAKQSESTRVHLPTICHSAISRPSVTGGTRATMYRRCG
jgi:GDPmannose 4,6-dehydratase